MHINLHPNLTKQFLRSSLDGCSAGRATVLGCMIKVADSNPGKGQDAHGKRVVVSHHVRGGSTTIGKHGPTNNQINFRKPSSFIIFVGFMWRKYMQP